MKSRRIGPGPCLWMLIFGMAVATIAHAEETTTPFDHLEWRAIGPVNMSGRVADVEGIPGRSQRSLCGISLGRDLEDCRWRLDVRAHL